MTLNASQDRELFDRIARRYARKDLLPASAHARRIQLEFALGPALAALGPHAAIVEVGCGAGAAAAYLAGRYGRYTGIDQSPEMIRLAAALHGHRPAVRFVAASLLDRPLPAGSADLVLAEGALHHMADPAAAVAAMAALGRRGAWVVAREPLNHNPVFQLLRRLRGRLDRDYSRAQRFFSETELTAAFAAAGLDALEVQFFGFFSTPFAQLRLPLQWLALPLSRRAAALDLWLARRLPRPLGRAAFNLVVRGRVRR